MRKIAVFCPYCDKLCLWCDNSEIYGKNIGKSHKIWLCKDCNAYVHCHNNTMIPMGELANKELRDLRIKSHKIIDSYWKNKYLDRGEVYTQLKEYFGKQIHIGESNKYICNTIIKNYKEIFKIK